MQSIRKAAEALKLLSQPPYETSVADLARALGVTASNASRILSEMREAELVDQDTATRRYRPGPLAMRLATGFLQTTNVMRCVEDAMVELATRTHHTAWTGVLEGTDVVTLGTQHGGFPVRFGIELGRRLPCHATAMGKALLALLPDDEIRQRMQGALPATTQYSLQSVDALLEDLAHVRICGYACSNQELFLGIKTIAIALQSPLNPSPIALSLSFPLLSVDASTEQALIDDLMATGRAVGLRIGDPRWLAPAKVAPVAVRKPAAAKRPPPVT
ncbi:MAG: IclR family transcriptional regulator [Rhodoferax sp.]|nr:IclR family transcriptional regulator [Rhodoferax sp.]